MSVVKDELGIKHLGGTPGEALPDEDPGGPSGLPWTDH
jgi:hypothetical protein